MEKIKNNSGIIIGAIIGAISGYLYWQYIGCSSGSCPISSSPIISPVYTAIVGGLLGSMFRKSKKQKN